MKKYFLTGIGMLLLLIVACNAKNSDQKTKTPVDAPVVNNQQEQGKPAADTAGITGDYKEEQRNEKEPVPVPAPRPDWDKKIIKTATLRVQVKNGTDYYKTIREKVKQYGGYVASEEQTENDWRKETSLVIKVPVDQFDAALNGISASVEKTEERSIRSEDVTAEFVDTRARMESKRQVRLRYLELLKQAKNIEEILQVQSYINTIQEEIDAAAGRVQYLSQSAAYSTINLTYYEITDENAANERPGYFKRLGAAFKTGANWLLDAGIGIVSVWPLVLVGAGLVFWLMKRKRM